MIALRPRDQHVWDPRQLSQETEAETKTNYCETETKKVVSRPRWGETIRSLRSVHTWLQIHTQIFTSCTISSAKWAETSQHRRHIVYRYASCLRRTDNGRPAVSRWVSLC